MRWLLNLQARARRERVTEALCAWVEASLSHSRSPSLRPVHSYGRAVADFLSPSASSAVHSGDEAVGFSLFYREVRDCKH